MLLLGAGVVDVDSDFQAIQRMTYERAAELQKRLDGCDYYSKEDIAYAAKWAPLLEHLADVAIAGRLGVQ